MSDPSAPSPSPESSDVLAGNRTRRPDALASFKVYTGGWNFTSMDYLASVGYTGMPGFVIGLLWALAGFFFLAVVVSMHLCCRDSLKQKPDFERFGNYTTLGLLVLFTVLTICGCGALFTGIQGLHADVSTVITYLMAQFTAAAKAGLSSLPPIAAPQAAETELKMETATNSTSTMIHHDLDSIVLWLVIFSACMLGFALVGLVFVAWKLKPVIYTLVTIGWLLVMGTWILFGVFLMIDALIGDTCVAMQEWAADPRSGTAFDIFMQCGSSNGNSTSSSSHFRTDKLPPLAEVPSIENAHSFSEPSDDSFTEWVQKTMQRKTSSPSSSNSSADSCAALQEAFVPIFNTIVTNNCPSMRRNTQWVWIAIATLSTGSTLSVCLWIVFTRRCTMSLTKVGGSNIPTFQLQESSAKKTDAGASYHDAGAHSTGSSTPSAKEDVSGGSRRRSKPTVHISINT